MSVLGVWEAYMVFSRARKPWVGILFTVLDLCLRTKVLP